MSQYKISKKRLAEIIKEEYQSLQEPNPQGGAERSDQLGAILDASSGDPGRLQDIISYFVMKADAAHVEAWLDERGLMGGPGASAYNRNDEAKKAEKDFDKDGEVESSEEEWEGSRDKAIKKKVKKESLDSIRDLIQQELQNL
tara:strand:+ start:1105 stop:1533 length:429 start_codon:yes stop_codon:yes gene_type:complete